MELRDTIEHFLGDGCMAIRFYQYTQRRGGNDGIHE